MVCDKCGTVEVALKSVICRDDRERRGVLCSACFSPLADRLWIVPGPFVVFGKCSGCADWFSLRELADRKPGGKWSAPSGVCAGCVPY